MERYVHSLKQTLSCRPLTPGEHTRLVQEVERVVGTDRRVRNLALMLGLLSIGTDPPMTPDAALAFWRQDGQTAMEIAEWIARASEVNTRAFLRK